MRARRSRRARGFTLIEMLVVMILVAMIVTVLFQGLSQAIRIRTVAGTQTAQLGREVMRRVWYRQLVNGLAPDDDDGDARFQGARTTFKGQSTNPIDFDSGAALPITVSLDVDAATDRTIVNVKTVSIDRGPQTLALLALPGLNYAFSYVEADGSQGDVWPRRQIVPPPQLPAAIWIVDASNNQATELLTASIVGRRDAAPRGAAALLRSAS